MSKNNKLEILFDKRFDHFNMSTQAPGFRHGEHQRKLREIYSNINIDKPHIQFICFR